jgi:ATP-dependent helicase HrpB
VLDLFGARIEVRRDLRFDPATQSVAATRGKSLGAIRLSSARDVDVSQEEIEAALLEGVRQHGLAAMPFDEAAMAFRERTVFAHRFEPTIPELTDAYLVEVLDLWLPPLLVGKRTLSDMDSRAVRSALEAMLPYPAMRLLNDVAPAEFVSPAGSHHPIAYGADGGPIVEVRAQALFGLAQHPMLARGEVPLTLAITSPAGRPIQTSRDLPSFWAGTWRDVAKEMRGRYPKHPWPDDPASALPTLKTKRASS